MHRVLWPGLLHLGKAHFKGHHDHEHLDMRSRGLHLPYFAVSLWS